MRPWFIFLLLLAGCVTQPAKHLRGHKRCPVHHIAMRKDTVPVRAGFGGVQQGEPTPRSVKKYPYNAPYVRIGGCILTPHYAWVWHCDSCIGPDKQEKLCGKGWNEKAVNTYTCDSAYLFTWGSHSYWHSRNRQKEGSFAKPQLWVIAEEHLRKKDTLIIVKKYSPRMSGLNTRDTFVISPTRWYKIVEGRAYLYFDLDSLLAGPMELSLPYKIGGYDFGLKITYTLLKVMSEENCLLLEKRHLVDYGGPDTLYFNTHRGIYRAEQYNDSDNIRGWVHQYKSFDCSKRDSVFNDSTLLNLCRERQK